MVDMMEPNVAERFVLPLVVGVNVVPLNEPT
jgi:hypothetical protein